MDWRTANYYDLLREQQKSHDQAQEALEMLTDEELYAWVDEITDKFTRMDCVDFIMQHEKASVILAEVESARLVQ